MTNKNGFRLFDYVEFLVRRKFLFLLVPFVSLVICYVAIYVLIDEQFEATAVIIPREDEAANLAAGVSRGLRGLPFVKGARASDYVRRAGGYTDHAMASDILTLKAGGTQWLNPSETQIDEGDAIWVPKDFKRPFSYYLGIAGQAASIISVVLSMTIIIIQLSQ